MEVSKERGERGHLVTPSAPPAPSLLLRPFYKQTKGQRGAVLVQRREGEPLHDMPPPPPFFSSAP